MRRRAYSIYLFIAATVAFLFSVNFTTSAIYRLEIAGLNPLQLILVGTALELAVFTFEIPTGVVADSVSRRLSIIIGYGLIGSGFLLEGALPLFATILLAQVLWGLGYTFTSGAQDAWLADELGDEQLAAAYLRGAQLSQAGSFLGIFVGVTLGGIRLNIPYFVAGSGLLLLALVLALTMPERNFTPAQTGERTPLQSMTATFSAGFSAIRRTPLLQTMLVITLFYGLYSEGLDRLWEAHFLTNFTLPGLGNLDPIYWFAIMRGTVMILSIAATEALRRRAEALTSRTTIKVLAGLTIVLILGLISFGLAPAFGVALAAYIALAVVRSTIQPLLWAWYNRGLPPAVRATVLSTFGQMDAIGQVAGGPPIGAFATRFGLRAMFVLVGLLLTPVLALYARAFRQSSRPVATDQAGRVHPD